jgi:hypothetical protein
MSQLWLQTDGICLVTFILYPLPFILRPLISNLYPLSFIQQGPLVNLCVLLWHASRASETRASNLFPSESPGDSKAGPVSHDAGPYRMKDSFDQSFAAISFCINRLRPGLADLPAR